MPFKLKLIKELQKNIRSMKDRDETTRGIQTIKQDQGQQKNKSKQRKKLVYKHYSLFQLILTQEPTHDQHIINFYNIFGINQRAIKDPSYDESLFTTMFYLKNVKKVEVKANTVVLQLSNVPLKGPPLQYITERFKSFGDVKFYNLANLLNQAAKRLKAIDEIEVNQNAQDGSQYLQKYIESMGSRMYYCRSSVNKMVFSKSFLQMLQFNVEDFAIDCLRFKTCLTQFVSAQPYFEVAYKMMENIRNLFDLLSDKISLQTFLDSSLIRFKQFMQTKNNKKLYCKLKAGMPNPMINLFQIQEIISRSDDFAIYESGIQKKKLIESVRHKRELEQINNVRNVISLPKNLLPENERLVTGYLSQSVRFSESKP